MCNRGRRRTYTTHMLLCAAHRHHESLTKLFTDNHSLWIGATIAMKKMHLRPRATDEPSQIRTDITRITSICLELLPTITKRLNRTGITRIIIICLELRLTTTKSLSPASSDTAILVNFVRRVLKLRIMHALAQ